MIVNTVHDAEVSIRSIESLRVDWRNEKQMEKASVEKTKVSRESAEILARKISPSFSFVVEPLSTNMADGEEKKIVEEVPEAEKEPKKVEEAEKEEEKEEEKPAKDGEDDEENYEEDEEDEEIEDEGYVALNSVATGLVYRWALDTCCSVNIEPLEEWNKFF